MKPCAFCLEPMQAAATACPHCTRVQPPSPEARRATSNEVAFAVFGLFALIAMLAGTVTIYDKWRYGEDSDERVVCGSMPVKPGSPLNDLDKCVHQIAKIEGSSFPAIVARVRKNQLACRQQMPAADSAAISECIYRRDTEWLDQL